MGEVASIEGLLAAQTLWRAGRSPQARAGGEPTGYAALDALLPQGGWPAHAITELLLPADGVGELSLLMPTLARISQAGGTIVVIAPPYIPYALAWRAGGVNLTHLHIVQAASRDVLWSFEQCLRSGACAVVLGWVLHADMAGLRRLQMAADAGRCLGFVLRDARHAGNPSPAALRMEAVSASRGGMGWQVRKCRGGPVPTRAFVPVRS